MKKMSCIKLVRISDTASKADILENIRLPAILGRGALLKCRERKITRRLATLEWDNEGIVIASIHKIPTYIKTNSRKKTLHLGESAVLKDGDTFGLRADSFWYKIVLNIPEDNDKQIKEIAEKIAKICEDAKTVKEESTVINEINSFLNSQLIVEHKNNTCTDNFEQRIDNNEYISAKEEKADTGVLENTNISQVAAVTEKNCLLENSKIQPTHNNSKQRQLAKWLTSASSSMPVDVDGDCSVKNIQLKRNQNHGQKMNNVEDCKIPEGKRKIVKQPTSTVTKNSSKLSKDKQYHVISQEFLDESPIDDKKPRQSCQFGENCFKRNPQHKKDYSHPNDTDYILPKDINSDGGNEDERPECEHGVDCCRKNPQHEKDFKHTSFPQLRHSSKIAKRKREEDDNNENKYDEDDSSDDYAPTDSDADSPFDDDGVEDEDTKRTLKEAKKFSKKKSTNGKLKEAKKSLKKKRSRT